MHSDPVGDGEKSSHWPVFCGIGIALALLLGCAAERAPLVAADGGGTGVAPLRAAATECSRRHGYDPAMDPASAERGLLPNELEWRQCVYDAIRQRIEAAPQLAFIYEQLIAEDLLMTTAIQQGTLTRGERHRRLEELTRQVAEAEAAYARSEETAELRERARLRQVYDDFRGTML
jgi:hypothetical protein